MQKEQDSTIWLISPTIAQDELAEIEEFEALANSDLERERAKWDKLSYKLLGDQI